MFSSIKAFSFLIFIAPNQVSGHCVDSEAFVIFHDGKYRTCQNINFDEGLRQALCVSEEVNSACPHSCSQCCEDNEEYRFTRMNGMKAGCRWLRKDETRKSRYCYNTENMLDGVTVVRDGCPKACNSCRRPVPSRCINNPTFTFRDENSNSDLGCDWITKTQNVSFRRNTYCGDSNIAAACPQACGFCIADDPTFSFKIKNENDRKKCVWISENSAVTMERVGYCERKNVAAGCAETCSGVPDDAIQVTTKSPTVSPSLALSDAPSSDPTVSPPLALSDAPSSAPTGFTCTNDDNFSFKLTNIWLTVGCSWIVSNNVDVRRRNYCGDSLIAAACPQACGTCCADVESFTFPLNFDIEKSRKCRWLEEKPSPILTSFRKSQYCNSRIDGHLLGYACAKSCDMCA